MAAPVWILSVDLQTKTATFQSGMADAAKSARGAFNDIKSGSTEMSGHLNGNMFASRHAIMAVSESLGVQMPRAITALITHVGPLGAALEAAFPFLAIALGAVLLLEKLEEMRAAGVKLTEDQVRFGTAAQNAFNGLDDKLLQSGIRADELRNDHIGALHKQLELIDRQSMAELVHTFGEVAKAADVVFADIKSHWYTFGIGATGAKHALDEFQTKYESLLSQGKDKEASDLLRGTRESAEKTLAMMNQARGADTHLTADSGKSGTDAQLKYQQAMTALRAAGVGYTDKEVTAQQTLVEALEAQVSIEGKVAALKKSDSSNATQTTGKEINALLAEGARQAAEHAQKMGELSVAAEREQAEVSLTLRRATIAERLALDMHLADEEYNVQMDGNKSLQDAVDRGGKDAQNQLKALQNKAEELTAQHDNALAGLQGKAQLAQSAKDLQDLEQSERDKIEATERGSVARLAVLANAIRDEELQNLQETSFYRELLTQRTETIRQAAEEQSKLTAEAAREEAENTLKMGELGLAAEREQVALRDSARRVSIQMQMQEEIAANNAEYNLKMDALQDELNALDKSGKDYENKLKEQQDKERQLTQEHENAITEIRDKATIERNQKILAAEDRFEDEMASGLTQAIMGQKSFASAMASVASEVESGLIQMAIKHIETNLMTKESDAAAAARKAYLAGMELPFPANVVVAPVLAAAAFAGVMAFQEGTDMVPGVGRGDTVPAMLEPGEGIVPGGVMDGLRNMARAGSMGGGDHYHVQVKPTYHLQALDTTGMEKLLDKHSESISKHVSKEMRKMNR